MRQETKGRTSRAGWQTTAQLQARYSLQSVSYGPGAQNEVFIFIFSILKY